MAALLDDADPVVCAHAAIMAGREKNPQACPRLVEAVQTPDFPMPMRCAAAESLAGLPSPEIKTKLQQLLDQYGQFAKRSSTPYLAELHAELLRRIGPALHPAEDRRFLDALHSPTPKSPRGLAGLGGGETGRIAPAGRELGLRRRRPGRAAALTALAVRAIPGPWSILPRRRRIWISASGPRRSPRWATWARGSAGRVEKAAPRSFGGDSRRSGDRPIHGRRGNGGVRGRRRRVMAHPPESGGSPAKIPAGRSPSPSPSAPSGASDG